MNKECGIKENKNVKYCVFGNFEKSGQVTHCFTTRHSGVSSGNYATLNPGKTTMDSEENVAANRDLIEKAIGYYPSESIDLEHGNKVYAIKNREDNNGKTIADAVMTHLPNEPLVILYADCVPVFILDRKTPAIALVHAGWRGTAAKIVTNTIEAMKAEYGTDPQQCLAAIAPSIGKCCFEVDADVAQEFISAFPDWKDLYISASNNSGKYHINLWDINKGLLLKSGLLSENISVAEKCTSCNSDLFYSYRRDKRDTGRMAAIFALK